MKIETEGMVSPWRRNGIKEPRSGGGRWLTRSKDVARGWGNGIIIVPGRLTFDEQVSPGASID